MTFATGSGWFMPAKFPCRHERTREIPTHNWNVNQEICADCREPIRLRDANRDEDAVPGGAKC